jgi:hypothetical protein
VTPLQLGATAFALLSGIVAATVGIEARYEKAVAAEAVHERLAAASETDRLTTQLELVKLKIDKFVEISKVRPLTESEHIELRSAESERNVILQRLAAKG